MTNTDNIGNLLRAVRSARAEQNWTDPATVALAARLYAAGYPLHRITVVIDAYDEDDATVASALGGAAIMWHTYGESCHGEVVGPMTRDEIEEWLTDATSHGWDVDRTIWVANWASPINPETGERIGESLAKVSVTVAVHPPEPACVRGHDHDWRTPHEVLGGMPANPGVWGHGGGLVLRRVCAHCAAYEVTDTWAQDDSGRQGLTSLTYEEADENSRDWVANLDEE